MELDFYDENRVTILVELRLLENTLALFIYGVNEVRFIQSPTGKARAVNPAGRMILSRSAVARCRLHLSAY